MFGVGAVYYITVETEAHSFEFCHLDRNVCYRLELPFQFNLSYAIEDETWDNIK